MRTEDFRIWEHRIDAYFAEAQEAVLNPPLDDAELAKLYRTCFHCKKTYASVTEADKCEKECEGVRRKNDENKGQAA